MTFRSTLEIICGLVLLASINRAHTAPREVPVVHVLLTESAQIQVGSAGDFLIRGRRFPPGDHWFRNVDGKIALENEILDKEILISPTSDTLRFDHNPYRGSFVLKAGGENLRLLNQVDLENYLRGVVAKEMPGSDLEALKAQAVASRTLAYQAYRRDKSISATMSEQVYGGMSVERAPADDAITETRGIILTYRGQPLASPLFSSTCGGETEDSEQVFGKPLPYLKRVMDSDEAQQPYCQVSPYFTWKVTWRAFDLEKNLARFGVKGDIEDLLAAEIDPSGRIKELLVRTPEGTWKFRGFAIRKVLALDNGQPLYSTSFEITKFHQNGETLFLATGHGKGHGVGMCQWGAMGMARQGKTFRDILTHYYPGTEIQTVED